MTSFVDIPFPSRIAFGAQRMPGWSTAVAATVAGRESRNQNWSRARHRYDVSFAVRTAADYRAIVEHFHQVRGRLKAFPFLDPLDYRVSVAAGVLVQDAESSSDGYQLAKVYGASADLYTRPITRPTAWTIWRTRALVTTDITSQCAVDDETGLIDTGAAVIDGDVLAWEGAFVVPCRYDTDELPAVIVNRTGADADYDNLLVQCDAIPVVEVREPA